MTMTTSDAKVLAIASHVSSFSQHQSFGTVWPFVMRTTQIVAMCSVFQLTSGPPLGRLWVSWCT